MKANVTAFADPDRREHVLRSEARPHDHEHGSGRRARPVLGHLCKDAPRLVERGYTVSMRVCNIPSVEPRARD
ncbi:hypothetical protein [Variovorax sp. YR216]|uniref:hypothetical protein n=1 Tax=Variovorax sp. YR216 TaxID=1882828 RepID=UPI00115FA187|nr:hypothetical protein [Variovorax sp. YR216]